jgi:hypothetical protein
MAAMARQQLATSVPAVPCVGAPGADISDISLIFA